MIVEKIERSNVEMGGGSGKEKWNSDLFRVVWWKLQKGEQTTIEIISSVFLEIKFDGYIDFLSDEDCFSQLSYIEVLSIIENIKAEAYEDGKRDKLSEIKKVLFT